MSYARWSSDNFRSDVYVYEDASGGWTTHVASKKLVWPPIPALPIQWLPDLGGTWDRTARRMQYPSRWRAAVARMLGRIWSLSIDLHHWSVRAIPLSPIGWAFDGLSFSDPTPGMCAARLEMLDAMGYRVPARCIEALLEDQRLLDEEGGAA
jgi:hypothetical protein